MIKISRDPLLVGDAKDADGSERVDCTGVGNGGRGGKPGRCDQQRSRCGWKMGRSNYASAPWRGAGHSGSGDTIADAICDRSGDRVGMVRSTGYAVFDQEAG